MAKRKPNGNYSGMDGNLVWYEMNGKGVVRTRSHSRKDTSEELGKIRSDFGVVVDVIKKFKPVMSMGFKDHTVNRSAYHSALSVNLENYYEALKLEQTANYSWVNISFGKLAGAMEATALKLEDGKIEIQWSGTEPGRDHYDEDVVFSGIYLNNADKFIKGPDHILRSAGRITIDPGQVAEGEKVDTFLAFRVRESNYRNKGDKNVSVGQWAGLVTF